MNKNIEQLCVDTIRTLSIDAVEKANSGHPGMPMGMADAAFVLWTKFLKHNPARPDWFDRDRFILSAGHGSMLLYSLLHLTGYDVALDELKNFRQWGSITPGHPEFGITPGVETTTGPLGQGFATGVGMAMAEAHLAARFNKENFRIVDHYIYGIVSDGDLMEGISHEAASLAGHHKLGKIIYLYDDNSITIDGSTDLAFTDDTLNRFVSYGWDVQQIDGHNRDAVESAIQHAQTVTDKPSIIACKTKIGYGSPNKEGLSSSHGSPLGEKDVKGAKANYGWDAEETFYIPEEVNDYFGQLSSSGDDLHSEWVRLVENYQEEYPEKGDEFLSCMNGEVNPEGLIKTLPVFDADEKGQATRKSSGLVLNAIAPAVQGLIGGSADLAGSNKSMLDNYGDFQPTSPEGKNMYFGVREHAMVAILNGMAMHKGVRPYGATFLVFSDYCKPAIRIAALSKVNPILIFTHDSIGLGEDGPTHQPIEHLAALRSIPNQVTLRPCDANEVAHAWRVAIETTDAPVSLILTRQNVPVFERNDANAASNVEKGAYVLMESDKDLPDVILMGTGSEVQLCVQAKIKLAAEGIDASVVSMPSWELFEKQSVDYRESVLPASVKARVSVEAASTFGWKRWVGDNGICIGIDHFGASAPYETLMEEFGFTTQHVVESAKSLLD